MNDAAVDSAITLAQRMALDRIAPQTWRSRHSDSNQNGRSYGGQLLGQAFHAALLGATGNPFIVSLINGVTAAVDALTQFKQRLAKITRDPVPDHLRVYDAIAAKNQEAARSAMIELIRLAVLDMPVKQRPKPL